MFVAEVRVLAAQDVVAAQRRALAALGAAPSPYALPGAPLYARFAAARARAADQRVVLAFHGTPDVHAVEPTITPI